MGGYGHRNMYYLTGLPGWMRFGYSPGWVGRSASGLGPAAEYFLTGRWPTPQMAAAWGSGQVPQMGMYPQTGMAPGVPPQMPREQELQMLKNQADYLSQQLSQIRERIEELEKEGE
ncbi:MAG: hypothetical protein ACUVXI_13370 [bacterium]